MNKKYCGVIVLFNPDLERLRENVDSIINQIDEIFLVDNGSMNIGLVEEMFEARPNLKILKNGKNLGIAQALNYGCKTAIDKGYDWVYLLDQDSVSSGTIIQSYRELLNKKGDGNVALLSPQIVDINETTLEEYLATKSDAVYKINNAITSGSLINLEIYNKTFKFREDLFIDTVDTDYSMQLEILGYDQYKVCYEYILHEVGRRVATWLKVPVKKHGKWVIRTYHRSNHSQFRNFYISRNNVIFLRRYKKDLSIGRKLYIVALLVIKPLFEEDIILTTKTFINGIKEGLKYDLSE